MNALISAALLSVALATTAPAMAAWQPDKDVGAKLQAACLADPNVRKMFTPDGAVKYCAEQRAAGDRQRAEAAADNEKWKREQAAKDKANAADDAAHPGRWFVPRGVTGDFCVPDILGATPDKLEAMYRHFGTLAWRSDTRDDTGAIATSTIVTVTGQVTRLYASRTICRVAE